MSKITFLGSASGQTPQYETVSFIIETNSKRRILVDTGPSVMKQLGRAGIATHMIDAVFITHCHGDHTLGYPYFMFVHHINNLTGQGGVKDMTVLASEANHIGLQGMLSFCYPPGKWPTFDILKVEFEKYPKGKLFNEIEYEVVPVVHTVPNWAISFVFDGNKVTYSSDTLYTSDLVNLAKGSDILIQEAMVPNSMQEFSAKTKHATTSDAARIATEAGAKEVILVHLDPPWMDKEEVIIQEVQQSFKGKVSVAHEFDEYSL